jgi:hypothetical protein
MVGGGMGGTGSGIAGTGGAVVSVGTSKKNWTGGNGPDMRPGNDCVGCHNFAIAGTVYPTLMNPITARNGRGRPGSSDHGRERHDADADAKRH